MPFWIEDKQSSLVANDSTQIDQLLHISAPYVHDRPYGMVQHPVAFFTFRAMIKSNKIASYLYHLPHQLFLGSEPNVFDFHDYCATGVAEPSTLSSSKNSS